VHSPRIGVVSRDPRRRRSGEHRDGGLLIGLGPRFGSGEAGAEMRTQDLAPTILDFFGVQSPPTSEGRAVPSLLGEA
jgi:predicted AlkP superfamily phosphohydrolase/phosphomutase